jgi:hypothetical protein
MRQWPNFSSVFMLQHKNEKWTPNEKSCTSRACKKILMVNFNNLFCDTPYKIGARNAPIWYEGFFIWSIYTQTWYDLLWNRDETLLDLVKDLRKMLCDRHADPDVDLEFKITKHVTLLQWLLWRVNGWIHSLSLHFRMSRN